MRFFTSFSPSSPSTDLVFYLILTSFHSFFKSETHSSHFDTTSRPSKMLTSLLAVSLLATAFAAPIERQNGITLISNCNNQGQVALTFDGKSCTLSSPYGPSRLSVTLSFYTFG